MPGAFHPALDRAALVNGLDLVRAGGGAHVTLRGDAGDWSGVDANVLAATLTPASEGVVVSLEVRGPCAHAADWVARVIHLCRAVPARTVVDLVIDPRSTRYPQSPLEAQSRDALDLATRTLVEDGLRVRWVLPLSAPFIYRLEGFFSTARLSGVEPVVAAGDISVLSPDDRLFVDDFVRYRILGTDAHLLKPGQAGAYSELLEMLKRPARAPHWTGVSGEETQTSVRRSLPWRDSLLVEAAGVLIDGAWGHAAAAVASLAPRAGTGIGRLRTVLLIGAYGGEHIGDAAILGGVVLRLHRRYGVTDAILMTQRPDHTRHLLPMIETPVNIEVQEYLHRNIRTCVDAVDAVVFAGGPLIDLPKQLVRHLYAAALVKARRKPFLMEGIGPGPFHRTASVVTARRLVGMADAISLRTRDSADEALVKGLECEIGRDPAFDYLETRRGPLTHLSGREGAEVERLLARTTGRPVIGVNVRPIYHHYTAGVSGGSKVGHTRRIEERFEQRLAEAFNELTRRAATKPAFIFFPMNAVQFGLSDMTSAFRISRHISPDVDWRVWEADASLDGVLALIRRLDVAVTMRFHATIFALSQNVDAIGVDYRIGKRDKVAAVLSDVGKGDQCARIDEMTSGWLINQLGRFVPLRE